MRWDEFEVASSINAKFFRLRSRSQSVEQVNLSFPVVVNFTVSDAQTLQSDNEDTLQRGKLTAAVAYR